MEPPATASPEMEPLEIATFIRGVDPTLEIEDPSDRRLFDSILTRSLAQVHTSHVRFMMALIARDGRKFRRAEIPATASL